MAKLSNQDLFDMPMAEFPAGAKVLYRVVIVILTAFSRLMWRWRVEEPQYLRSVEGVKTGNVIICNHTSMAEVVAIVCHLVRSGRTVRAIGKAEFFANPLVAWAFTRAGAFPVERGTSDMKALRHASHALQRGEDLLIFPEGTRIRTDEQPVEVHGGYALIAQMAKAPVVPMAVCGFRDITPTGKKLMRPMKCWLRCGAPLSLADAPADLKRRGKLQWLEREGMARVYALRDELRAEHPGRF